VVPAGGIAPDHSHGVHPATGFFLPLRVLSKVFRGKFVAGLKCLFRKCGLSFHGSLRSLADSKSFRCFLRQLFRKDWVVYAKRPFGGPEHVLHYLAQYTHRVAISNHRWIAFQDGQVTFRWKDYAHGNKKRSMTVSADEFLRRFLLHVLPRAFVRIRHCGFLTNRNRAALVPLCQRLWMETPRERPPTLDTRPSAEWLCPMCAAPMIVIQKLSTQQIRLRSPEWKSFVDTS
jgi:putative transposase